MLIFFLNDPTTTELYALSLHSALPCFRDQIMLGNRRTSTQTSVELLTTAGGATRLMVPGLFRVIVDEADSLLIDEAVDRKSTRLNSSHANISYALFCLKKQCWDRIPRL